MFTNINPDTGLPLFVNQYITFSDIRDSMEKEDSLTKTYKNEKPFGTGTKKNKKEDMSYEDYESFFGLRKIEFEKEGTPLNKNIEDDVSEKEKKLDEARDFLRGIFNENTGNFKETKEIKETKKSKKSEQTQETENPETICDNGEKIEKPNKQKKK